VKSKAKFKVIFWFNQNEQKSKFGLNRKTVVRKSKRLLFVDFFQIQKIILYACFQNLRLFSLFHV